MIWAQDMYIAQEVQAFVTEYTTCVSFPEMTMWEERTNFDLCTHGVVYGWMQTHALMYIHKIEESERKNINPCIMCNSEN